MLGILVGDTQTKNKMGLSVRFKTMLGGDLWGRLRPAPFNHCFVTFCAWVLPGLWRIK